MEYGIQLYSVRDLAKQNFEEALRTVASLGYRYVEFAGFFGHSAEEVRAMLARYGLAVSGAHVGCGELAKDQIEETLAYHKAIGNNSLIIPWSNVSTRENLDALIDCINYAKPILDAAGITLGYHNHDFELVSTSFGVVPFDELEARTEVSFEIDTYWAYAAGLDPIALLERLGDRVSVIHLKDGLAGGEGRALGEGTAPVLAVREYARDHGLLAVVESEDCNPTGAEEIARCMKFLKSLEE